MLKRISIRTKIILSQILLVAMVSVFIYTYYPAQQKRSAMLAIDSKIRSISNMFSIGVGIGMGETDLVAISEALNWAHSDSSVVYISVTTTNNQEIASLNTGHIKVPEKVITSTVTDSIFEHGNIIFYKRAIVYQNKSFGTLVIGYSLNRLDNDIIKLRLTTLYFSLALFTLGVILSIIIGNMITGNILKLDTAIKAIAHGAEHTRVRLTTQDEIGKLGLAFNTMLDKQEKSHQELIRYSEQLQKQNEELNQFSYVVSHDLKAPLRAIFKLSEWIQEDLGTAIPDDVKKNMIILRGRVFRLEGLINGLLEYSKIGRDNIEAEKVDVRLMLNDIIDLLNPPSHFTISMPKNLPVFRTKKIMLEQVFINILSNAIKYNDKAEGVINILFDEIGNYYRFSIEDNGMGIDPAYHEKIFAIFQTLEARDKIEGTGIGLSIVKKCVEDMTGTINLKSEQSKGAKFIFTWPKEKITAPKNRIEH